MEFRILGPLEVWAGESRVEVGGGKQRALLAILLLNSNEVVSSDRLIHELWGEAPPPTANKALQNLVSQLRKVLGDDVLLTRSPGYLVALEPESLDAHRFDALLERGRGALREDDPDQAAKLLRDALALWRGSALAEFAFEPFAQGETRRLEELRLGALEERIEADLALGGHGSFVAELEELVAAHPLRERLRGQLMLALYRSGRQAEALEIYREGRRILVEELGLEPGADLQSLERGILTQDPTLAPSPRATRVGRASKLPRRSATRIAFAAGVALVAGAAVAAAILTTRDRAPSVAPSPPPAPSAPIAVTPDSLVRIDPQTNKVVEVISVGQDPGQVAVAGDFVFVVNDVDETVSRVDLSSGRIRTISGLNTPLGLIAEGADGVWLGSRQAEEVVRLDAATAVVTDRIKLEGLPPIFVAVGAGSLWVAHALFEVSRVSLETGKLLKRFEVGQTPVEVAYGEGAAWVVVNSATRVSRIDEADDSVLPIQIGGGPSDVAVGFGSVWVTNVDERSVWRLDPVVGRTEAIVPVGKLPWEITTGAGAVWVTNADSGTVSRIDPKTNSVVATIELGYKPHGLVVSGGALWVSVAERNPEPF